VLTTVAAGDPDYEEWRARTAGRLNIANQETLQNNIHARLAALCHDIDLLGREMFGVEQDDSRLQHLLEIFERSVELSHMCAAQRSRLCFYMPHFNVQRGILLDPIQMEDVSNFESAGTREKMVKFAVFPCLYKYCNDDSKEVRSYSI